MPLSFGLQTIRERELMEKEEEERAEQEKLRLEQRKVRSLCCHFLTYFCYTA
jgi:hypothetical protein